MKFSKTGLALLVCSVLIVAGYLKGPAVFAKIKEARTVPPVAEKKIPIVAAKPISTSDIAQRATVTGTVRAAAEVDIVSKVSGRLERLRLEDGTPVDECLIIKQAGMVVGVIDHEQLKAEVDSAAAAVKVAEAAVAQAEVARKNAEREMKRISELFNKKSVPERDNDQAKNAYDMALAAKIVAESSVLQSAAALKRMRVIYDEAFIKSPIAGVVTKKYVDEGNMVGPSMPIIRVTDLRTVKVVAGVTESLVPFIKENETRVTVKVDTTPDAIEGKLTRVGAISDSVTRTVQIEINLPNEDCKLMPGSFARVTLHLGYRSGAVVVPDRTIVRRGGETYVFIEEKGIAKKRIVRTGIPQGDMTEVSGVLPGELLITGGHHLLHDGEAVKVEAPEQSNEIN